MRWGQHFLVNRSIAEKMIRSFLPVDGPILEIGPGRGILTEYLVNYRQNNNIIVVELDKNLFYKLKEKSYENLKIINRNILNIDLCELFPDDDDTVNVIGNVPYYISKDLMDWVITHRRKIKKGMFMMQKEFVNKFISPTNAQSILFGFLFLVEKLFEIQPGSFSPQPRVKSSVFAFEPNLSSFEFKKDFNIDVCKFYDFLKCCFRNRRKTLLNNLSWSGSTVKRHTSELNAVFSSCRISPRTRAEQLTLKDFLCIYRHFLSFMPE